MRALLLICVVAVLAAGGLWASASSPTGRSQAERENGSGEAVRRLPNGETGTGEPARPSSTAEPGRRTRRVKASVCPPGLAGCRSVRGRVLFVESNDPDGDGDLHVVLAAGGVTGPGLTAVDVAPELRPQRDPRPGDQVSAAGPVQRGSFGQSQIHAVELHLRRR